MILRRFTQHIKEQNWFAVGLDVIVVIVGIFLGMQVTEWNDDRNKILLESQYIQRLLDDVNSDLTDSDRTNEWNNKRVETQALVLKSLRDGKLSIEDLDDFNRGLYWAGVLNPIQRRWQTVEELKSTGNLSILRDIVLRNRIAEIETTYMRNQKIISLSESRIQMLRVSLSGYMNVISAIGRVDGNVDIKYDFDALKNDQELINKLSVIHAESQNAIAFRDGYYRTLNDFRDELTIIVKER